MGCQMRDVTTKQNVGRWIHPIVIGSGQRLVRDGHVPDGLRVIDRKAFDADIVVLSYRSATLDGDPAPSVRRDQRAGNASIDSLALAMLGVSSDRDWVELDDDDVAD